jgi:hypothetical protein
MESNSTSRPNLLTSRRCRIPRHLGMTSWSDWPNQIRVSPTDRRVSPKIGGCSRLDAPPIAGSERARSKYTELIALGIGEHNPRPLALSDVRSRGAERKQPLDLNVSVVWPEVEVQPILNRLRLREGDEEESRQTIRSGSNLELVGVVADDYPAERLLPPPPEAARIPCIDDCLLPLEAHEAIVEPA